MTQDKENQVTFQGSMFIIISYNRYGVMVDYNP